MSGQHAPLIFLPCVFIYSPPSFDLVWDPKERKRGVAPRRAAAAEEAADDGDGDGGGEAAGVVGAAAGCGWPGCNRLPTKLARLASDSKKSAAAGTQVSRL